MTRYKVTTYEVIEVTRIVESDSETEAIALAENGAGMKLDAVELGKLVTEYPTKLVVVSKRGTL